MKRYKRNLALLLAAVTAVLSAGCEIEEVPRAAVEEERQVLEEASSLAYTGDLEDITLTSDLTADGCDCRKYQRDRILEYEVYRDSRRRRLVLSG